MTENQAPLQGLKESTQYQQEKASAEGSGNKAENGVPRSQSGTKAVQDNQQNQSEE
jgi:hypothetical protein